MKRVYTLKFALTLTLLASALTCIATALIILFSTGIFSRNYTYVREYAALLSIIENLYIGDYDTAELSDAALHAVVESLGDKWSAYMSPGEYADYLDYSSNSYTGIGIGTETDEETGGIKVLYVYKGSAAEAAGLLQDDVIIAIDGGDIANKSIDEIKALLTRGIGESVELTVKRTDGSTVKLTAEYGQVFTDPVAFELLTENIGYISVGDFFVGADDSFIAAVDELRDAGAKSLIIDVRNNGGGRVSVMTKMLDYLLPEGEIFVEVSKDGIESTIESDANAVELPAAVLVNRFSVSAAEYFAATLCEYGYARSVGEQTTGKNRSQIVVPMPSGGALRISTDEYLTKNRVSLHDTGGLSPEYPVEITDEQLLALLTGTLAYDDDPQMQKAISLLEKGD